MESKIRLENLLSDNIKKSVATGLLAVGMFTLGGCAMKPVPETAGEVMRNNSRIIGQLADNSPKSKIQYTASDIPYSTVVDCVQYLGENKVIPGFNLNQEYFTPGLPEQEKEKIAMNSIVEYYDRNPQAFSYGLIRASEELLANNQLGAYTSALTKDAVAIAIWSTVSSLAIGSATASSSGGSTGSTLKVIGKGGSVGYGGPTFTQ